MKRSGQTARKRRAGLWQRRVSTRNARPGRRKTEARDEREDRPPNSLFRMVWRCVINIEIRMTLFMKGRLVMQIEFMVKSYGALGVRCHWCFRVSRLMALRGRDNKTQSKGEEAAERLGRRRLGTPLQVFRCFSAAVQGGKKSLSVIITDLMEIHVKNLSQNWP